MRDGLSQMLRCVAVAVVLSTANARGAEEPPRANTRVLAGHAHNDYSHPRPLLDALAHRFRSVETDVYLVDGSLLVGHDRKDLKPDRTLQALYLDPLRARIRETKGAVYPGGPSLLLFIDLKTDAAATYAALRAVLAKYTEILTRFEGGKRHEGAVTIAISGNRDWKAIAADEPRYAGVDGRMADLDRGVSAALMPVVSDHWRRHFRWDGKGEMPAEERTRLRDLVERAHKQGCLIRFWATPEVPALWRELLDAKVDLINTDQLDRLRDFLLSLGPATARDANAQ